MYFSFPLAESEGKAQKGGMDCDHTDNILDA